MLSGVSGRPGHANPLARHRVSARLDSNFAWRLSDLIDQLGLVEWLDLVVTSAQAGYRKPANRRSAQALARLGAEPSESLYVGDDPVCDRDGARGAGLMPLLSGPAAADGFGERADTNAQTASGTIDWHRGGRQLAKVRTVEAVIFDLYGTLIGEPPFDDVCFPLLAEAIDIASRIGPGSGGSRSPDAMTGRLATAEDRARVMLRELGRSEDDDLVCRLATIDATLAGQRSGPPRRRFQRSARSVSRVSRSGWYPIAPA